MSSWFRSLLFVVLLCPLVVASPVGAQDGRLGKIEPGAYDLGAMVLTPADLADLGLDGYALSEGWTDTLDEEFLNLMATSSRFPQDEMVDLLEDTEFQYSRVVFLDIPDEDDPTYAARRVTCWINLHGTSDRLDEMVDAVMTLDADEDLEGTETIGDYSRVTEFRDPGQDSVVTLLGFAHENLTAFIQVSDYVDRLPDKTPTVEEAEGLANRLVERIDQVMEDGAPDMDMLPLRMESDGSTALITGDFYVRLDGETMPTFRESDGAIESRDEEYEDWAIDSVYTMDETFGLAEGGQWLRWSVRIRHHEREADAEAWMEEEPERSTVRFNVEDLESDAIDDFGKGTVLATYEQPANDVFGTAVFFRSGEYTIGVYIFTRDESFDEDVVLHLAEQQFDCMEGGDCEGEVPIPDEILAYVEG